MAGEDEHIRKEVYDMVIMTLERDEFTNTLTHLYQNVGMKAEALTELGKIINLIQEARKK